MKKVAGLTFTNDYSEIGDECRVVRYIQRAVVVSSVLHGNIINRQDRIVLAKLVFSSL